MPELLHILSLDTIGGVEQLFVNFLAQPQTATNQQDHTLVTGGRIHGNLTGSLEAHLASFHFAKYAGGFKLPRHPRLVRQWNQRRLMDKVKPDLGILWNRFGSLDVLRELHRQSTRAVYYEHGIAWLAADTPANREFIAGIDSVVCASHAAKRVLELRWNWPASKPCDVVLNCLRPAVAPTCLPPRSLPENRPISLGVAARLIPLKGIGVALHALHELKRRGNAMELKIAGAGPMRAFLKQETQRLGIASQVIFHDCIMDMSAFYQTIDLLLLPSVREPFGLVILEAGANGCPAIGAKIDGVPEAILDGRTGICLKPTLDLQTGLRFGGRPADFPGLVYEPDTDCLIAPRFLDPARLADGVEKLLGDPEGYERMSAMAMRFARENSLEEYARRLRGVLQSRLPH